MIPDSYDPCPCASGKKYKFCCQKIFLEMTEAMVACDEGKSAEALKWLDKAKAVVGETAEVLCRESVIYFAIDQDKSDQLLTKCLQVNPHHPRAHYLLGLRSKELGDYQAAIQYYLTAINHYPESDHFHLNETYNNLGCVYHCIGDMKKAKDAWEKALLYMPSDRTTQRNLSEFA